MAMKLPADYHSQDLWR